VQLARTSAICSKDLTVVAMHIQLLDLLRLEIVARNAKMIHPVGHSHILNMTAVADRILCAT